MSTHAEPAISRKHLGYIIFITLGICLGSILNFVTDIGKPFPGFLSHYNHSQSAFMLHQSTPSWWRSGTLTQLTGDDKIIAVDDILLSLAVHESALYEDAYAAGKKEVTLTLANNETKTTLKAPLILFSFDHLIEFLTPFVISGFGFWIIALVVFRTGIDTPLHRTFIYLCLIVALNRMTTRTAVFYNDTWVDAIFFFILRFVEAFIGFQFLRLAFHFPTSYLKEKSLIFKILTGASLLLAMLMVWVNYSIWILRSPVNQQFNLLISVTFATSIGIGLLSIIIRLLREGFIGDYSWLRGESFLLLGGIMLTFPYLLWIASIAFFDITNTFWERLDLHSLALIAPMALGLSTLRFQTFNRTSRLFLVVVALGGAGIATGMVTNSWRYNLPNFEGPTPASLLLLTNALFFIAPILWLGAPYWNIFVKRLFKWDTWSQETIEAFPKKLIQDTPSSRLSDNIVEAFVSLLGLEFATLWLPQADHDGRFNLASTAGETSTEFPLTIFTEPSNKFNQIVFAQNPSFENPAPHWLSPLLKNETIHHILPLRGQDGLSGILAVGVRKDGRLIGFQDLGVMRQAAQLSGMFLESDRQSAVMRGFPSQLAIAQEQEREKIAQELHDTIQQFLGRLPFYLETSLEQVESNPKQATKILSQSIRDVEQAARTVREIRNDLAPQRLEDGLEKPLQELIGRFENRAKVTVALDIDPKADAQITLERRHALYRVIQQALDNIYEHAEADQVSIRIQCMKSLIKLSVKDNGIGMKQSSETNQAAGKPKGFGMLSMDTRFRSLGGDFGAHSVAGRGTLIVGTIPYR